MGSTCVSGEAVHSRARTRQVTHSVPNQIGRLPEEFLWLVLTSRARAHTPSRPRPAGVPNRLLAGIDALAGRARLLAERLVDGLGLSPHEGRASQACGQRRERIPALRCRSGPVWSSERRYEVIKLHIRQFLREKETLTYRRSGCYPNLSSLSTPFFHRRRTGLRRSLKTSVRVSIRMLLLIPRPCQPLFSAGRTGVNRVLKDTGPGTVG
jgi:hypothetical protein